MLNIMIGICRDPGNPTLNPCVKLRITDEQAEGRDIGGEFTMELGEAEDLRDQLTAVINLISPTTLSDLKFPHGARGTQN